MKRIIIPLIDGAFHSGFGLTIAPKRSTVVTKLVTIVPNWGAGLAVRMKGFTSNLSSGLFGATRQAVLALLYSRTGESFYLREIVRLLNGGVGAVQRELAKLASAGIIKREKRGNQVFFSANEECPIFSELKGMILKTAGISGVVLNALEPLRDKIRYAFIYGSFAQGDERAESDVDVMIIGEASTGEVASVLYPLHEFLGREVNPVVYPLGEFVDKLEDRNHFVTSIVREAKIFLIGKKNEFGSLGKVRQTQKT